MSLSKRSIATLLDLVEIKLSCIEVMDREDAREMAALEGAKRELMTILQQAAEARRNGEIVPFGKTRPAARPLVHA
jgi:hypothetical protein